MSDLSYNTMVELHAAMAEIERPWVSYIGLVELRPSEWVPPGMAYSIDTSRVPNLFAELHPAVVIHPDDVEAARTAGEKYSGAAMNDVELAAFLYWASRREPRREPRCEAQRERKKI